MKKFFFGICALLFPLSAWAGVASVEITASAGGGEVVRFMVDAPVEVKKAFTLSSPNRVAVDIARVDAANVRMPKNYAGKLVKSIRFGQFDATTSRIVLDVNTAVKVVSTSSGSPFIIEIAAIKPMAVAKHTQGAGAVSTAVAPKEIPKPLIMIDAGHGGQDPGAIGLHGTREKDITLNYARALRDALQRSGRYRAALTREGDHFVMLPERVSIARKAKADIFISLHADSNPKPEARGLSIYTLSENASDDESAALAERENKADIIPGINLNGADADVASILIDLTQRETMNKSALLADAVVDGLQGKITKLSKTHRFAGFRVLKAPDIPSVLVELGFLSNETDERLLLSPDYREAVIASVVKGIDRFHRKE